MTFTPSPDWQYPANPADGDIIVRGDIKGTYDADTKTWAIGQIPQYPGVPGPEGPQGPRGLQGEPGKGVEVTAVVPTLANLPAAAQGEGQFWVVSDTNTLYYSDGVTWFNLGNPIQGPQGEPGEDGADGTNGVNGTPGRGWKGTTIIDGRPLNYQITFNSDDGLEFTTDNIMGPKGDPGELAVATRDTIGGIKIGRGLTILPDGTAQAGETFVDLETVPLTPEGTVYNYTLQFAAFDKLLGAQKTQTFGAGSSPQVTLQEDQVSLQMPTTATKAQIFLFHSTAVRANQSISRNNTTVGLRSYQEAALTVAGGTFTNDLASNAFVHYHNLIVPLNSTAIPKRRSVLPLTKLFTIQFEPGALVTLKYWQYAVPGQCGNTEITSYQPRLYVLPFQERDFEVGDDDTLQPIDGTTFTNPAAPGTYIEDDGGFYFQPTNVDDDDLTHEEINALYAAALPRPTEDELLNEAGKNLRVEILTLLGVITEYTQNPNATEAEKTELEGYRLQLYGLKDLPGTPEEVQDAYEAIADNVLAIAGYTFRYEPPAP